MKKKGKKKVTKWQRIATAKLKRHKVTPFDYSFKTNKVKLSNTGTYRIKVSGKSSKATVSAKTEAFKVKILH